MYCSKLIPFEISSSSYNLPPATAAAAVIPFAVAPASSKVQQPEQEEMPVEKVPIFKSAKLVKVAADDEIILEKMKCSSCKKIPPPTEVATCTKGHLICVTCVRKLDRGACPEKIRDGVASALARCGQATFLIQSELYEYLYNNSKFKCKFGAMGCKVEPLGIFFLNHIRNCRYRPRTPCPFTSCKEYRISLPGYAKHIVNDHHDQITVVNEDVHRVQIQHDRINSKGRVVLKTPEYRWVCAVFNCFNLTFMVVAEERHNNMHCWTQMVSREKEVNGRKFVSYFRLMSRSSTQMVEWSCDVYPFKKPLDQVVGEGECIVINKQTLDRCYCFQAGQRTFWNMDVQIHEKEMTKVT